jgi:hypothetical protein
MSAQSRIQQSSSSTTITSANNVHVLQLSLLGASLESVVELTDRGSVLYSIRIPSHRRDKIEIAEVVKARVLSSTKPEFLYLHIRELIREVNDRGWVIRKL